MGAGALGAGGIGEVEAESGGDRFVFDEEGFAVGQCAHRNIPQDAIVDEDEGFDLGVFECGGDGANEQIVGTGGFGAVAFGGDIFKRIAEALHLGLELAFGDRNPMELERSDRGLGQNQGFGLEDDCVDGESAGFKRGKGGCGGAARSEEFGGEGFLENLDAVVAVKILEFSKLEAFKSVYCFRQVGLGRIRHKQGNQFAVKRFDRITQVELGVSWGGEQIGAESLEGGDRVAVLELCALGITQEASELPLPTIETVEGADLLGCIEGLAGGGQRAGSITLVFVEMAEGAEGVGQAVQISKLLGVVNGPEQSLFGSSSGDGREVGIGCEGKKGIDFGAGGREGGERLNGSIRKGLQAGLRVRLCVDLGRQTGDRILGQKARLVIGLHGEFLVEGSTLVESLGLGDIAVLGGDQRTIGVSISAAGVGIAEVVPQGSGDRFDLRRLRRLGQQIDRQVKIT